MSCATAMVFAMLAMHSPMPIGASVASGRVRMNRRTSPAAAPGTPGRHGDHHGADVAVIEHEAAATGAVLAIVPAAPGSALASDLGRSRWSVASDWYLGWPAPVPPD